jgi:hypothetical protein
MLQGTKWKVKVEAELSKEFMINRDLRQFNLTCTCTTHKI